MIQISFKEGYKYQLGAPFELQISLRPEESLGLDYVELTQSGLLRLAKGYAWDGPSGPTPDLPSFMRASLVHDALYQLMRHDLLDRFRYRKSADLLMRQLCVEDGMNPLLAAVAYGAVRLMGERHARQDSRKQLLFAP